MATILILHSPETYEVRKAFGLISRLEGNSPHRFLALTEFSATKEVSVNLLSFFTSPPSEPEILGYVTIHGGSEKVILADFLIEAIDQCDKVIVLPCEAVVSNYNFTVAIGYALGKGKIIGSIYYPGFELPHWYRYALKNTVENTSSLLKILESI